MVWTKRVKSFFVKYNYFNLLIYNYLLSSLLEQDFNKQVFMITTGVKMHLPPRGK